MPLVVDREQEKSRILAAFEECIKEKPLFNVTLRDIAAKAGMTHPKILNYFSCRDEIVLDYCDYAKNYMAEHCKNWFAQHDPAQFSSKVSYLNAFMEYVANGTPSESRPIATVQTYVLAKYNNDIARMVQSEFASWREVMKKCLISVYGDHITENEAEYMMVLITGVFICNYTNALSGNINHDMLGAGAALLQE